MDQSDNDLQGTDGSGSLGGPDVRRRIPLKLISKQPIRSKPGRAASFGCKQEERVECKSGDAYASHRRYPQQMFWDYKLNLIGEKDESPMHFCDTCGLPIRIYGRMIPCKHVFCYECAVLLEKKADKLCPGCTDAVQRIEQCLRGSLFMCSVVPGCKRTYLSQRDLQAHINHRHLRSAKPAPGRPAPPPSSSSSSSSVSDLADRFLLPPPAHLAKAHVLHKDPYGPPPHDERRSPQAPPPSSSSSDLGPRETYRIATVTIRKHSNLITVPIQDDSAGPAPSSSSSSSSDASREPRPQPGPPPALPLHHPLPGDYPAGPVVTHGHHMMAQQQHYRPPPLPTAPMSHPLQLSSPGSAAPHMMYNQAPPLASGPPPITPPPGHIINPMPPYMNRPPPGPLPVGAPPPHHYNPGSLPQFSEDQGTLSPPFNQPGGMSPGIWPTPRGPHPPPPRMQGPPPQGPLHPDQTRFRPYYQ
ncbi:E3 ubiquitin-protein ligase Hakai-like isoform X2 [Anguilla anguilla]|uniref:E3 ubiquitin-protein ligase Hakai-like isoform X2 n=1 Tax=Anguilla anguilla TaxID=7936 RepID=UPI0015B1027C|nr:E3 ubiquitin-protein ligase Hakai-like isoform X2 [Anguilla anguilla]